MSVQATGFTQAVQISQVVMPKFCDLRVRFMQLKTLESGAVGRRLPFFLLLTIGSALAVIHVVLVERSGDESLVPLSLMFWLSVGMLVWQKRHKLVLKSDAISIALGIVLLTGFLIKGIQAPTFNYLAVGPFIVTLGLTLLISGWRYLMQYRSELILMFLFGIPKVLLWPIVDIREPTARFSTLILHCLGFDALQTGTIIALPTGSVDVLQDCSGLNGMLYLLAISGLFLVILPLNGVKQYFVPLMGIAFAFSFNAARVSFLAIMAALPNPEHFQNWHSTSVFSLGALGLFCGMYCLLLWCEKRVKIKRT